MISKKLSVAKNCVTPESASLINASESNKKEAKKKINIIVDIMTKHTK